MFFPISIWFPAFALTVAIEAPVVAVAFRKSGLSLAATGVVFLLGNLATHLGIWYIGTQLVLPGTPQFILASEVWAIAAEALLFWAALPGVSAGRALLAAAAANAASFLLGSFIGSVWPDAFS